MKGTLFDALALAALCLKEKGWKDLLQILPSSTLDLAFVETINTIWNHVAILKDLNSEEKEYALVVLREARDLLETLSSLKYLDRAFSIADSFKVTVYDSLYIATAEAHGFTLVTLDEKQRKITQNLGVKTLPSASSFS
ncbi:VapC-type toxin [Ignicoccus pacificus DSM 13166]|uniref:VapC-type toxin n=1 Tax=Ignicoccus pacificus DSM 13166 TaxID=940294 RepID=A0A977K9T5_9CREN|nr:VapC-type toxin [Ignicoccus pacificus DSM 13166]